MEPLDYASPRPLEPNVNGAVGVRRGPPRALVWLMLSIVLVPLFYWLDSRLAVVLVLMAKPEQAWLVYCFAYPAALFQLDAPVAFWLNAACWYVAIIVVVECLRALSHLFSKA